MQNIGVDTELIPYEEVRIHPLDIGLHRGYAVFDFFPIRDGKPWFLKDYLRRFGQSARAMGIPLLFDAKQLSNHLQFLVDSEGVRHGGCKLLLTGGGTEDGYTPKRPTLYTYAFAKPKLQNEPGGPAVRINLLDYARQHPAVKTTNYSAALRMQGRQLQTSAAELVYHHQGYISEASRSNVMIATDKGELWIPPTDSALRGITISHTVAAARQVGIKVLEKSLPVEELLSAPEVMITSSTRMVQAVKQVESTLIGHGEIGSLTSRLAQLFETRGASNAGWL